MAIVNGQNKTTPLDNALNLYAVELKRKAVQSSQFELGKQARRLAWCTVLFFHVFNGLYTMGLAYLYHYMSQPFMSYYANMIEMMGPENYKWITLTYALISALNWYSSLTMVVWILIYRRLVFDQIKRRLGPSVADLESSLASTRSDSNAVLTILRILWRRIAERGNLFDVVLHTREMVDIASQIHQAHSYSLLVSSIWMNQVFALLIFFNCITGILAHMVKEDVSQRRLLCTVIALLLDFAWGFLLPANIIFTYIPTFVSNGYSFPQAFFSSDTAFTKAVLECKQFFINSWTNAFTTILPSVTVFTALNNVKALLMHSFDGVMVCESHSSQVAPGLVVMLSSDSRVASHASDALDSNNAPNVLELRDRITTHRKTQGAVSHTGHYKHNAFTIKSIHALQVGAGVFVITTSTVASRFFGTNPCGHDCKLQMRPWFTSHCACSVQEINCYDRMIDGSETNMREILDTLDSRVLNFLIVSHCAALSIPSDIRRFPELTGLQFYNANIVGWPQEAALSLPYFPRLGYVYIIRCRLDDGIPEGLTTDLASNIIDIEIIRTHIGRSFPSDIADKWGSVMELLVEHCALQEFPTSLASIPSVLQFSIAYNNISSIPDHLLIVPNWQLLILDGNPLQSLPAEIDGFDALAMLTFQDTRIGSVPTKLLRRRQPYPVGIAAHNSTYCYDYSDSATGTSSSTNVQEAEAAVTQQMHVFCALEPGIFPIGGMFPLSDVDALRQL